MKVSIKHLSLIIFVLLAAALLFWSKKLDKNLGSTDSAHIENLKKEVDRTCSEAQKQLDIFRKKFPTSDAEAMKSEEWRTAMSWGQACDTAKADLEDAQGKSRP